MWEEYILKLLEEIPIAGPLISKLVKKIIDYFQSKRKVGFLNSEIERKYQVGSGLFGEDNFTKPTAALTSKTPLTLDGIIGVPKKLSNEEARIVVNSNFGASAYLLETRRNCLSNSQSQALCYFVSAKITHKLGETNLTEQIKFFAQSEPEIKENFKTIENICEGGLLPQFLSEIEKHPVITDEDKENNWNKTKDKYLNLTPRKNLIKIGTKGKTAWPYVLYLRTLLNRYQTAEILARGKFISLAVDVALICQRLPTTIENIETYTEKLQNKKGHITAVSAIRIIIKRAGSKPLKA